MEGIKVMKLQYAVKRIFDFIVSLLGLIILFPLFLIIAILIKIECIGLRPGEKLYEELLMSEEGLTKTANSKIFIGKPVEFDSQKVMDYLDVLRRIVDNEDVELIDSVMRAFVTTYIRPQDVNLKEVVNV